ncbi:hypothetical protein [Frankia gtarii]|uniref:hypothetical protein n=1 Tax=Frankia gtarii TaxID=2950102 RepID=UPI0021BF5E31|nr:hypothetical protein [Frankia gtarii]
MLSAFWGAVGGKLADRWSAVATPALVFWLGGLGAWIYHRRGEHRLDSDTHWLTHQSAAAQIALLLAALLTVAASGVLVAAITSPVLRLLEGYWPRWAGPMTRLLTRRALRRAGLDRDSLQAARARLRSQPTPADRALVARLERRHRQRPVAPADYLPTSVGNLLRAAETRPTIRYGLDTVVVWPRFWLVLPDPTRQALLAARSRLDVAVGTAIWSVAFCAFSPLAWPALPVGLGLVAVSVAVTVPARARVFADLIDATFDIHRTALYQQLRLTPPVGPADEPAGGRVLTTLLWRGTYPPALTYTEPTDPGAQTS